MNFIEGAIVRFVPINNMEHAENAHPPCKKYSTSVGIDLFAQKRFELPARQRMPIKTGYIAIFPYGTYGRIEDCSGVALNKGTHVLGQIVDRDYQGELIIIIQNLSEKDVIFEKGEKLAQIVLQRYLDVEIEFLHRSEWNYSRLSGITERGTSGLGKTDVKNLDINPRK